MTAAANATADVSALTIDDRAVPGPAGAPPVEIRVYRPARAAVAAGAALYIHGGGFAVGSVAMEHANAVRLANDVGIVVVSVEYRLAPEHPYPAAIEDCFAALTWVHGHGDRPRRGHHAHRGGRQQRRGRSRGRPQPAGTRPGRTADSLPVPRHPRDRRPAGDAEHAAVRRHADVDAAAAEQSWRRYLGDLHGGDVPPYAAPARATDLTRLPPAYVSTMEFDPLRDEGILYALRLLQAGVSVELHTFPGTFHGSAAVTEAAVTRRQFAEMALVLRRALAPDA